VSIKLVGCSFAKCTTCDDLQQFILKLPDARSSLNLQNIKLNISIIKHLVVVYMPRGVRSPKGTLRRYCALFTTRWTLRRRPALPRMRVTTKATQKLGQFLLSVTGMVAHGHSDGAYAHYAPSLWPGDSNFTISSLARLFHRLEGVPIWETCDLFPYPPPNALFGALLRRKSRCLDSLKPIEPSARRGSLPLPKKFYLHLDNSAKDNKN